MYNNLRAARKAKGLTQKEVAAHIGISQNNYSYWENGKVKIDNKSLQKLADYFDVTIDYLLGRSNSTTAVQGRPISDLAENFIREYGELFSEKEFQSYVALYKLMDARQRIFVLGMIIGWLKDQGLDVKIST